MVVIPTNSDIIEEEGIYFVRRARSSDWQSVVTVEGTAPFLKITQITCLSTHGTDIVEGEMLDGSKEIIWSLKITLKTVM